MGWYEKDRQSLLTELDSNAETGLTSALVAERQTKYGKNLFDEQSDEKIILKILRNLRDISTIILILAAILSLIMGIYHENGYIEFAVIIGIVILNIILAVTQERSAEKSLSALKRLNSPTCVVLRDGKQQEISSIELVPGDIMLLQTGDLISADARLLELRDLMVDESILTGESAPSEKNSEIELSGKVAVADQVNMIFSGCLVTAGRAKALVTATGMSTQMGHIAGYLNNVQKLQTPLQIRLSKVGKSISLIAVLSALVMFAAGFLRGNDVFELLIAAISLAVAAVPETLPLIVTLTLTHGVTEMVRQNALIRRLPAVETLGSTSVICTDKTGTLTQNQMTITRLWTEGSAPVDNTSDFSAEYAELLNQLALASDAAIQQDADGAVQVIGDPTETAILRLLSNRGGNKTELERAYPRILEIPFSSDRKMMTTVHRDPEGGYLVLTKGAFDRVPFANAPAAARKEREDMHDSFARDALRIIALGSKHVDELPDGDHLGKLEQDLRFKGLVGIIDPPRPGAGRAIAAARNAGIRTVMITGDHALTAGAIAHQIGLLADGDKIMTGVELSEMSDEELIENIAQYSVYARVSPEDKIRIVEAWQEHDEVVAMTGDGVNDAPALKAADVGVAMGISGTEVAKSAADMVLTDDNFGTIVAAIHKGRDVFSNIRKTVYFLLVCNFSEIIIMLGAQLLGWRVPLTPIMLLLINVIGDGIPGLALAREKSDPRIMLRHPIGRRESLFTRLQLVITTQILAFVAVAWIGYYIGAYVHLSALYPADHLIGQTMAFLVVGWTSIAHIFTVRSRKSILKRTARDNPGLVVSAAAMMVLFALFVIIPPVRGILGLAAIGGYHWLIAVGLSIVPTIVAEIGKFFASHSENVRYKKRVVHHDPQVDT